MRQIRWPELHKYYEKSMLYHLGKANFVANTHSRVFVGSMSYVEDDKMELVKEVHQLAYLGVRVSDFNKGEYMCKMCLNHLWG